jgi:iron(III) transport system permease protein
MLKRFKNITHTDIILFFIITAILLALIVFLVLPLGALFIKAFQDREGNFVWFQQFSTYLNSPGMVRSFINTLHISTASTIISVSTAFVFAYCLSRRNIPGKRIFQFIAMLPLLAPTMLLGICLIYLFGNQGILTRAGFAIELYGRNGIIIAESIFCFPVALMILTVALSSSDNRLYEAADVMGTSAVRKMFTITLPNIKYGLISAIFVCFTYSFTDFGAPAVVGGNYNVLATDVYKQVIGQQNFNMGAVVGLVMMLPTVASFFINRFVTGKQHGISSKAVPYEIRPNKLYDRLAFAFCLLISLFLLGFFAVSLYASLITFWPWNMSLTLANYDFSRAAGGSANVVRNSIITAVLTALIGTAVTFLAAYVNEKVRILKNLRKPIYFMAIAPMAIPGTVIGLSYILFFNPRFFPIPGTDLALVNSFNGLYGTMWILIIVNIIYFFSVPFITASTALKSLDKEYETVSDSLGVPFYKTLMRVTLPMSFRAIVEIAVYYFVNAMVTVSAVVFLYTPVTRTASVTILNIQDAGEIAVATAMSMIILGVNILVRLTYEIINVKIAKKIDAWKVR